MKNVNRRDARRGAPKKQKMPATQNEPKKPDFPMRINKFLALRKYATRKGGDELVSKKKVFINGRLAVLGDKVKEDDLVEVRLGGLVKKYIYYVYNKPVGVITHSPQRGEQDVLSATKLRGVFPVGRLDKESHGLLILTNDGRITDKLLNPDYVHEKEYVVKTREKLRNNFKERMEAGVKIEGGGGKENDGESYTTKPCRLRVLNDNLFRIIITEGKKHQIRRMCVALFNEVIDIERVRIMNVELAKLPKGSYRELKGDELAVFMKGLGF
ncbi:rRNA pseudouridine synthase [Candidatus Parcubacteria bacterium]|nr:rRNA pseudouridine synthase [Candidatus Parcubacteria bacterium]